ncbi:glycosyltransferase family 2 protein [Mucilaginibacter segetis]|uniref:Glycosyltransferase family 2 protein n=1 Tax=Mucilaginibacter segetis TaxID=2793071 RepID=A0A934PX53_9SPHI|nr:glycosyltransferase family 2 protein [Mucilaginibacter segetis]MBK0380653.1 glycosyltransferase family 2 protein [Mucilaginibacter segetis]
MSMVSVVIPNYNHAPYLQQRIDSVLAQTYQDFELIILDDCSTDNSRQVIESYRGNERVSHIIFNQQNSGGPFHQWKKGIELAQGKYIWIAESDDWCETTLLETLVQGLDNNTDCVLGYVQSYVVSGDNTIEKISTHDKLSEYVNGKVYIKAHLAERCDIWNASMVLFKKDAYKSVSPEFTGFKMCGDWLFYIGMAKQGEVFISGRVLNYFRNHDKDVSGKMYSSGNNYVEEIAILKILKKERLITLGEYKAHLLFKYIKFVVFSPKFTPEVRIKIREAFYNDDNESYKWFLKVNAKLSLLKIRTRRRLNLMLK